MTEVSGHWKLDWLSQANIGYLLEETAVHVHAVVLSTSKGAPLRQHVAAWESTGYAQAEIFWKIIHPGGSRINSSVS